MGTEPKQPFDDITPTINKIQKANQTLLYIAQIFIAPIYASAVTYQCSTELENVRNATSLAATAHGIEPAATLCQTEAAPLPILAAGIWHFEYTYSTNKN